MLSRVVTGVNQVNDHFPILGAQRQGAKPKAVPDWRSGARMPGRPGEGGDGPGEADFPHGKC